MFRYLLTKTKDKDQATLAISGNAVFIRADEMDNALAAGLACCRELVIDVSGLESFDSTFQVLLCSLHRRSELENKSISIVGALPGRSNEQARQAKAKGCLLNGNSKHCPLCEPAAAAAASSGPGAGEDAKR